MTRREIFLASAFFFASGWSIASVLVSHGTFHSTLVSTATSKIHLFQNHTDGGYFAVKEFPDRQYLDPTTEFSIGASLNGHEHIVSVHDMVHDSGSSFQTMEYLPESLRDWVVNMEGVPSAEDAACVFRQTLDAVSYMHSQGIAHLDLKLPNVMLATRGQVYPLKIIDFGSAVRFRGADGSVTLQRGPAGTIPFLPPEVFIRAYEPRLVDIWALALIYCQMLKPYLPWRQAPIGGAVNTFGIFSLRAVGEPDEDNVAGECDAFRELVSSLITLLPGESRSVISRMLEPDPQRRASWAEIWADDWVRGIHCASDEIDKRDMASPHPDME